MVVGTRDLWWGVATPSGPAATWWSVRPSGEAASESVHLRVWGSGAQWFRGRMPSILGEDDDVTSFTPHHDVVVTAWRSPSHRNWRVAKTGLVINSLVPSIIEQKVTGKQAFAAFQRLVYASGMPVALPDQAVRAAGPQAKRVAGLRAAPTAAVWKAIPSWKWLQAGVEPPMSRTIMRALEVAHALESACELPLPEAHRRLRSIPGIGVWTAAKVAQTAWGDADAPTFADYHIAQQIGYALLGRDTDDSGMAELLEPYRGHRYRAERMILGAGPHRRRHGARMALPTHLPTSYARRF